MGKAGAVKSYLMGEAGAVRPNLMGQEARPGDPSLRRKAQTQESCLR